jgi:hypothetical protein
VNRTHFLRALRARRDVPVWLIVAAAFVAGFMFGEARLMSVAQALRCGGM